MTNISGRKLISCIAIGDHTAPNLGAGSEDVVCIGSQSGSLFDSVKSHILCLGHPGASGTAIPNNSVLLGSGTHTYMFLDNATVPLDTDTSESPTHVLSYNSATGRVMRSDPAVISRREFKQNIRPVTDEDLEMIMKLQPVQYQYKKAPTEDRFGLIVEDVERVMPQLVSWETTPPPKSSVGYSPKRASATGTRRPYALKYENLTALLLAFVQRLASRSGCAVATNTIKPVDSAPVPAPASSPPASQCQAPEAPVSKTRKHKAEDKPLSPVAEAKRGESPIKLPMLETTQAMTRLAAEDGDCILYFRKPMTRGCYFIGTRLDGLYYEQAVRMGGGVSLAAMIR